MTEKQQIHHYLSTLIQSMRFRYNSVESDYSDFALSNYS